MYTCVIISSSLKPYSNFGPDLSPDLFANVNQWRFMIKETDTFKTATGILSGRTRRVGGHDA